MGIPIAINGFGRIGKCILMQLLENKQFNVVAINATNINISEIEDYLRYDSNHRVNIPEVTIIGDNVFTIRHHNIHLLNDRKPENLKWRDYGCKYVIDATGAFLTEEKCKLHDVDRVIITAPAKDNMPTFIYGVNMDIYNGENIVSASSCTTNCLAPCLKLLESNYTIEDVSFTTIHAATASQYTVDVTKKSSRTNRSILNNIIPHTTGATSSVTKVLPELTGKIYGTSLRVPVSNCSLVDVNIRTTNEINLNDVVDLFKSSSYNNVVTGITDKKVVSSDFMTTTTPCILDKTASIEMGKHNIKLMLWYDNEWAYSTQILRLIENMEKHTSISNL